jgi:hypothetical protein
VDDGHTAPVSYHFDHTSAGTAHAMHDLWRPAYQVVRLRH